LEGHYRIGYGVRSDILLTMRVDFGVFMKTDSISSKVHVYKEDLMFNLKISLAEALCGFSRTIKMPSGRDFEYVSYDTVKDGDLYVIEGEGIRRCNDSRGNLYIYCEVMPMPPMTPEMKRKIWELMTGTPYSVVKFKLQPNVSKVITST
jgi:DnaJ-class molecular chaperone